MPGCCVRKCKNSGAKGYQLFRIPKRPTMRKLWLSYIQQTACKDLVNVTGSINFRVCEIHFSQSQWTLKNNRKKALKVNAFPDLLQKMQALESDANIHPEVLQEQMVSHINVINHEHSRNETEATDCSAEDSHVTIQQLQNKLKAAYKKIKLLENKIDLMKSSSKGIFSEDQLIYLEHGGNMKGFSWSESTCHKALKMYMACGTTGFEEILKQGLPYPSIRTIQKHIQNIKFRPGVVDEVIKMMKLKGSAPSSNVCDL